MSSPKGPAQQVDLAPFEEAAQRSEVRYAPSPNGPGDARKVFGRRGKIVAVVLLAGVLPCLASLVAEMWGGSAMVNEPVHEFVEVAGGCIAVGVALLLLLQARHERGADHLGWVAAALLAMGLLDAVHGLAPFGLAWSWLRHGATLTGGVLFALVWVRPPAWVRERMGMFVLGVGALALAGGVLLWARPQGLPQPWSGSEYLPLVKVVNGAGGVGFLAAAMFFLRRYAGMGRGEDLVLASHTLLFGTAGVMFGFSHLWGADWWVWHGFRLGAYGIVLIAAYEVVVDLYGELARGKARLEERVRERTAELEGVLAERKRAEEALRESEQRFRALFENMSEGFALGEALSGPDGTARDFRFLEINDAFTRQSGLTREILGRPMRQVLPNLEGYWAERYCQVALGGEPVHFDAPNVDTGKHYDVFCYSPSKGQFAIVFTDMTERKRAEAALRESEARMRAVFGALGEGIIFIDRECRVQEVNEAAERMGYSLKFLTSPHSDPRFQILRSDGSLLPVEEQPGPRALRTGQAVRNFEMGVPSECGELRWVLQSAQAVEDGKGQIIGAVSSFFDITERKRAELELKTSEEKFSRIFSSSPNAISVSRFEDGVILDVNEMYLRLFGVSREEVIGHKSSELGLFDFQDEAERRKWLDLIATGKMRSYEMRYKTRTGTPLRVLLSTDITTMGGEECIIATLEDVTERKQAEAKLRESEERFRVAQELSPDGFTILRPVRDGGGQVVDFTWLYANATAERFTGKRLEELEGRRLLELFPGHRDAEFWEAYRHVAESGERRVLEAYYSGETVAPTWFRIAVVPVGGDVAVLAQDITERKRSEVTLSERARLLDLSYDAIMVRDAHDRITYWNKAAEETYGYSRAEALGQVPHDLLKTEFPEPLESIRARLHQDNRWTGELTHTRLDGTRVTVASRWSLDRDPQGQPAGILETNTDITERKQAEESVRQSEEQLRALADSMLNLAWCANGDGYLTWYNRRWYEYTGTTPEQMEGWGWQNVHDPQALPAVMERWQASIATGEPFEMTFPLRGADGKFRRFLTRGHPLKDAQGHVVRWFGTNTDVEELKRSEEALRQSEDRLRLALQVADLGTWDLDLVTGSAIRSLRHDQIFGYQELQPEWTLEIALRHVLQEDRLKVQEAHARADETGGMSVEARVCWADGSIHWINSRGRFYYDSEGRPVRIIGIVADITERKRAEEALRQRAEEALRMSEQEFRSLAEAMPQIVWATRPDGWNIYFNQQWVDYTGMTMEESHGHGWNRPFHPDDKQRAWGAWQRATQHDERYSLECRLRRADGVYRWWLIRGEPMRGANGEILKWFGTCTDIEEIKQAQAALQEAKDMLEQRVIERTAALQKSQQLLQDVIDGSPSPIFLKDSDGKFLTINTALEKMLGRAREELKGKTDYDIAPQGVADYWRAHDKQVMETGKAIQIEEVADLPDGHHIFLANKFPLVDANGQTYGVGAISHDITDRKRMEKQMEASLREKEVMLKEIHHRVKNNLQVIASLVDLQAGEIKEPGLLETFADIRDRVRSMALVHEKLYQSESLARVNFADYMQSLLGYLSRSHAKPGTTIELKTESQAVLLSVDKAVPCGLMISELVSNAYKHAFRGRASGEIRAALSAGADGRVCLRVGDNGVGLPPGLDWRQCRSLGLRLIRLLSEQLHAVVEVRSRGGTEFLLVFEPEKSVEE
jgi:PAS domain S-box-containing protein